MPRSNPENVRVDFLKADLEAGFAMVQMAESACAGGDTRIARKAIDEARRVCRGSSHWIATLSERTARTFRVRVAELESAIERADRMSRRALPPINLVFN